MSYMEMKAIEQHNSLLDDWEHDFCTLYEGEPWPEYEERRNREIEQMRTITREEREADELANEADRKIDEER